MREGAAWLTEMVNEATVERCGAAASPLPGGEG